MDTLLSIWPEPAMLAAFLAACAVLFITPGPDMSLFLAKTISGGRRLGTMSMLGATAGCLVHTTLAALGVSALLAASSTAFTMLKVVGSGYLLWLAVDAVRNGSALRLREGSAPASSPWRTFLLGLGVNLTNPKVVLFFVTFLPQFVEAGQPHPTARLFVLGLLVVVLSTPFNGLLVLAADRAVELFTRRPRLMRAIDLAFAGIFGLFAIRIATLQGR